VRIEINVMETTSAQFALYYYPFILATILFPEPALPLTSGRKTRALGATILKEPNCAHLCSLHLQRTLEMVASGALVFRPLVKGNERLCERDFRLLTIVSVVLYNG